MMPDLIPVTIVTGFLGAGKTTLLNRILTEKHGQKIAVIENEFGEESIDNDLLVQSEDEEIITMNNGCICCTIRGDLADNLIKLVHRKKAGEADFFSSMTVPKQRPRNSKPACRTILFSAHLF